MRLELARLQLGDEVFAVIKLVGPDRGALPKRACINQGQRSFALRSPRCDPSVHPDNHAVAVFHQQVAHEAQFRFLALALADQARVRIGLRGMRVIAPLFATEV